MFDLWFSLLTYCIDLTDSFAAGAASGSPADRSYVSLLTWYIDEILCLQREDDIFPYKWIVGLSYKYRYSKFFATVLKSTPSVIGAIGNLLLSFSLHRCHLPLTAANHCIIIFQHIISCLRGGGFRLVQLLYQVCSIYLLNRNLSNFRVFKYVKIVIFNI